MKVMSEEVLKYRGFYEMRPCAPIYQKEFGYYVLDRWINEGNLKPRTEVADYDEYLRGVFGYDKPAIASLGGLGWCEAAFKPAFEVKLLEDLGDHELVQDEAGRSVLYFKDRRSGFMPEYRDCPVKDMRSWEENVKWRLDGKAEGREASLIRAAQSAKQEQDKGYVVVQHAIGGYMYLRSLMGPEQLLYMFYDDPDLIHECMKTWLELTDYVTSVHQKYVEIDELFLAEDICYNSGALISPDMMQEFLFPYYQQAIDNIKRRNCGRKLHLQIDTDGDCSGVIPLYMQLGMDYMSPFEVASGCDVVEFGRKYPELRISGGIDKRVLAAGKEQIDRHLDYIIPVMYKRGGYLPTCDHGVPEEVSFENYMYYRERMLEYSK